MKEETSVAGFYQMPNEYKKTQKLLQIEAFNTFYGCQLKCLDDVRRSNVDSCSKRCEIALDDFDALYRKKAFSSSLWIFKFKNIAQEDLEIERKKMIEIGDKAM